MNSLHVSEANCSALDVLHLCAQIDQLSRTAALNGAARVSQNFAESNVSKLTLYLQVNTLKFYSKYSWLL